MKNIKYFIFIFFALFLFTADTFALTLNDIEFNVTKEELQEAVELIKNSDKFKEYEANYNYYIFTYVMANNQTNLFNFLDSVDRMRICFFENQNIDINNTINCDSSVLSFKLDGTFKSSSTTNQLYVQNINNLIDTNMTATYNEDLTDSKGNIIYTVGENIFANYYLKNTEVVYEYSETFNIFGIPILMSYDYYLENVINVYFIDLTLSDDIKFLTYIVINFFLLAFWYVIIKFLYTFIIYIKNGLF